MDMYGPGTAIKTQNDLSKSVSDFRQHFSSPANPNLSYGAVYFPNLVTAYPYVYDEPSTKVVSNIPQLNNQTLSHVKTVNPAVYNILTNAINSQLPVILPPSPGVAGIYNATDMARGVWKSPANAAVIGVTSLTYPVTDALQGSLNTDPNTGIAINAIRSFTGKGILIWGASTLDGNNNSFQYLSVRRFFIMVEASVNNALNAMAFMPDNQATWTTVRTMTENFLTNLWRQGALAGAKPEQAFFVKVGLGQTMTAADVQNHKLIVEIGMAVLKPAEFVILSITALTA